MVIERKNDQVELKELRFICSMCGYNITALVPPNTPNSSAYRGVLANVTDNFNEHNQAEHSGMAQMKQL